MKCSLLHKYKLEKKVAKLEKLVLERSIGKGDGPSKAYQIWDYLMNNGPKSVSDLKSALPKDITSFINFYADNNLLSKDGNMVSANADYKWDDVGVKPRTAQQELMNSIRNGGVPSAAQEEPSTRSQRAPRQRAVKQNLFSRKFDEVKAAVDAGQDVNQVNDKDQTPLLFAANSKVGNNSDIIEYLLTHGADLSQKFKGLTAFDLVCKNSNIDAMQAILENDTQNVINRPSSSVELYYKDVPNNKDVILLAASKERRDFDRHLHRFYYNAYALKIISKEQYEQAINTILNNCRYVSYSSESIVREVANEITNTIKKIADKTNRLINLYFSVFDNKVSANTARQLLDLCGEVADGKLSLGDRALDFIDVCKMLCRKIGDKSFMSNLLSPKFLSSLDQSDLNSIFYDAVDRNDINTLSKLVAAKVKLNAGAVCGDNRVLHSSKEITRLATRLIDKTTPLSKWNIADVASCGNEYLINYVIDMGYGEDLLAWCARNVNSLDDDMAVVKALKENGFEVPDESDSDSMKSIIDRTINNQSTRSMIHNIINAIKDDIWNRELEKLITDHPEFLFDDSVTKAIEDNNTTTSRQLRRRIERLPKDQDVYDL